MASIARRLILFHEREKRDAHARYLSWEHCYSYFCENPKRDIDKACLHLAFFLASWGMYRGSSFLLQKDYMVHGAAVDIIISRKYDCLQAASIHTLENQQGLVFELLAELRSHYRQHSPLGATDTLLTKITMATRCCTPAYDRFFNAGLRVGGLPYSYLNRRNHTRLLEFCSNYAEEFDEAAKSITVADRAYPIMKLVDMYFWDLGYQHSI